MTWDELKEEAKKMGYIETEYPDNIIQESLYKNDIRFYKGGWISAENEQAEIDIACGRSYDQMFAIMKELQ